ncbi:MAG TPA: alpha-1,4-glucan--maltose-1-phosphate maltosyltransferase [Verrucomicrobiae bacterium]|nr:alpha-1,4-glucan--maltose-1-phosphate maltosyltransferase [Verrucomicrobiae bacterium]
MTDQENDFPQKNSRVAIENVTPEIDGGQFALKRAVGERVVVEADIFADGHDVVSAILKFRPEKSEQWQETSMAFHANDRWRGEFSVSQAGVYFYTIEAWVDHFQSWRRDLKKRLDADQDVSVDLLTGAEMIEAAAKRATGADAEQLRSRAAALREEKSPAVQRALDPQMASLMARFPDRRLATVCPKEFRVTVDPLLARFSSWYELFPRSLGPEGKHGTFKDCEAALPRIAEMGFDILYLPPIHPIGKSFRKGKNNNPKCQPGEPGSPWAIGSSEGGHKSIHPELGTLDDFRSLVHAARGLKIELALDIAFQCAPDHPYLKEHPEWFLTRPDGSIQYAENPPKKYEDIVPFNFECDDWRGLWRELKSIFEYWIGNGIKVFRVDNPHTKPFAFWEWCITDLKKKSPDLIFLSEAFTRPKVMYRLAKLGFTQSYNYFPWRNSKYELTEYLTEITRPPVSDFLRYNLWPNTPDILTQFLQSGGREAFMIRLVLAATLGANYGIYGPAFELCENTPREPDSEEYLNSEKYEIRRWDLNAPQNLAGLITRLNQIRRENPALQSNSGLQFHPTDNDQLVAYSKMTPDKSNMVLVVVNLNPYYTHSGWLDLPLEDFELDPRRTFQMHDLLSDTRFFWHGQKNYVELNPHRLPAHVLRIRRYSRTEHDFDYFL